MNMFARPMRSAGSQQGARPFAAAQPAELPQLFNQALLCNCFSAAAPACFLPSCARRRGNDVAAQRGAAQLGSARHCLPLSI